VRVLLLSVAAGAGHTRAAQALEAWTRALRPDAEVTHVDVLDFTAKAYKKAYVASFIEMVDHAPALWGYLYAKSDERRAEGVREKFIRFFDKLEFQKFRKFVREFRADAVVATHFLPSQVFGGNRKKGRDLFKLGVVVTDFDVHAFWTDPTADRVFVATGELRARLSARGVPSDRIEVTGIPITPAFAKAHDRARLREGLRLDGRPVVLVMAGGAGVGAMEEGVGAVLSVPGVQVLAVAGRNQELKERLEKRPVPKGSSLTVFGFVDFIDELMAISDVAVTKSGGLTTSECLASGLAMVVRDPIPGQEERNADYLLEEGAGLKAHGLDSLRYKLEALLTDRPRLERMRENARRAGRPEAARAILESMGVVEGKK
jgi:processive 1,2-diacylglycerol beta-glucosyltransferase